ncbi:MAG: hypothetical protein QM496_12445, partial [Verrucomicrobiota bacterium]
MVLGEASDFESEELERLIEEKAELAMFKKRMQAVHGLLREVATGESLEEEKNWKLGDEKRQALLAVIDGEEKSTATKKEARKDPVSLKTAPLKATSSRPHEKSSGKKEKASALSIAIIVHLGLAALLMLYVVYSPAPQSPQFAIQSRAYSDSDDISSEKVMKMQKSRRAPTSPAHRYTINEADIVSRSLSSVGPADAASVAKTDSRKESRTSLSSIRGNLARYSPTAKEPALIESKLKNIILPKVEFQDTPLKEALATLQEQSAEFDRLSSNPATKGVNFNLSESVKGAENLGITMKLSNVPLVTALKYTSSLANMKYKVESGGVDIVPLSSPSTDLLTTTYKVSPSFMAATAENNADINAAADPFAEPEEEASTLKRRRTAKNILVEAGVTFAPGASVIYNPETSELIVRNTQDQLELVEAYKDSIKGKSEGLSFPDMNDNTDAPAQPFVISSFASSPIAIPELDQEESVDDGLVSMSSDTTAGFGIATASNGSVILKPEEGNTNSLLRKSVSLDEMSDTKSPHLGHGQTTPITILGESSNVPQSAPLIASAGAVNGGTVTTIGETTEMVTINPEMEVKQRTRLTSRSNDGATGGNISQLGESKVTVAREASMDVSGMTGGGQVNIGGGFQGNNEQQRDAKLSDGFETKNVVDALPPRPQKSKALKTKTKKKANRANAKSELKSHGNTYTLAKNNAGALRGAGSPTIKGKVELLKKGKQVSTNSTAGLYASTTNGHTRAKFLQQVAAGWELPVPTRTRGDMEIGPNKPVGSKSDAEAANNSRVSRTNQSRTISPRAKLKKQTVSTAPKVTARNGGRVAIEQKRGLINTKDYAPPQIPIDINKQTMDKIYRRAPEVVGGGRRSGTTKTDKIEVTAGAPITLGFVKAKKKLSAKPSASASIQIKKSPVPSGLNEKSAITEAFSTF